MTSQAAGPSRIRPMPPRGRALRLARCSAYHCDSLLFDNVPASRSPVAHHHIGENTPVRRVDASDLNSSTTSLYPV